MEEMSQQMIEKSPDGGNEDRNKGIEKLPRLEEGKDI